MNPIKRITDEQPIKKLKNEVDTMFQRFFEDPFFSSKLLDRKDGFTPACNIIERKDRYTIEVAIPGVDPHHIDIELDGQILKIKGEKSEKHVDTDVGDDEITFHTVEHHYGSFFRSFTLPENVDVEEIHADNKDGVLFIHLPKNKETKARRIKINTEE